MFYGKARVAAWGAGVVMIAVLAGAADAQPGAAQRLRAVDAARMAQVEIAPPAEAAAYATPGSVTLRAGSTSAVLRQLSVRQRLPLATLRANPVVALGDGTADLRPLLSNPAALTNIGARLKRQPALARVAADTLEAVEVDQGLVVRQFLSYRLNTGVCADSRKRAQLARDGVSCFERQTPAARAAAFANPADPHYVADRRDRAKALARAAEAERAETAAVAEGLATFRAMLRDPARRAEIVREIGAAEADRLARLDDATLEGEMLNAAEIEIEEVLFVPGRSLAGPALRRRADLALAGAFTAAPARDSGSKTIPLVDIRAALKAEHRIDDQIYLTGFTLGREHEWRRRVSVSIKWCLVGCKKTYFAELYAGFNYGFGLRFPVRLGGAYAYDGRAASFTPRFETINGAPADYAASGLPANKLFDGKELVAEVGAYAGLNYKVPAFGSGGVGFDIGLDLTRQLPAPFANGQFAPPMPGRPATRGDKLFESIDLIGGRANFGIVGGKVMPALQLSLQSDRLDFRLTDRITGQSQVVNASGRAYRLAVDPTDRTSRFAIGDPAYRLRFAMTPGIVGRLFVDVKAWSKTWDWPVWFPELAIALPAGNDSFGCHLGTVCARNYVMSPTTAQGGTAESADPIERIVGRWAEEFEPFWARQCPDEKLRLCATAIMATTTNYRNRMVVDMGKAKAERDQLVILSKYKAEAQKKAASIIRESRQRAARR
ncbi:hypothetical protein ACMT1E_01020 [Sphingomonas flavalba]|uniref:hypothetical protein n=1 Tax=Sphingomonas flavalba TaxID=2559804 RepID=UPI0039DF9D0E